MTDKTAASRTPGPWECGTDGEGGIFVWPKTGDYIAEVSYEVDAQFIVRACNAHDDLVAALREARYALDYMQAHKWMVGRQALAKLDAALKRATDNGA